MPWFGVGSNRVWLSAQNVLMNLDQIDVIERALFQFDDGNVEEGIDEDLCDFDDDDGVCDADPERGETG